jgi:hypothetical protein
VDHDQWELDLWSAWCRPKVVVAELTSPKDKEGNHLSACDTNVLWNGVWQSIKRGPDRLEHDVHARRTDHGVDTIDQLVKQRPVLYSLPKVDETKD